MRWARGRIGIALAAAVVSGLALWEAPAFGTLPSSVTARAMPVLLAGVPSTSPRAVCPAGPTSVGPTSQRIFGVNVTGEFGQCTSTSAQASDSSAMFTTSKGTTVEVTSITSFCDGTNGTSTSSSVYNGETTLVP